MSSPLRAAEALLATGISVIPVRLDGTKSPALDVWTPYQHRLPTAREVRRWFRYPAGIAAIGGQVSGNLEILDFDLDAATIFPRWVQLVEAEAARLVDRLVWVETPGDGWHLWYRCMSAVSGNTKLARRYVGPQPDGSPPVKTLIETRAERGYAITPGSPREVHETHRPYRLVHGHPTRLPILTADERHTLLDAARSMNEYVEPERQVRAPVTRTTRVSDDLLPGSDFNARGDVEGLLLKHGWTVARRLGESALLRRPGKTRGWSASLGHVAPGVMIVFSTNAAPFHDGHGYDGFAVYALLEHRGDYVAAAKALHAEGYGARPKSKRRGPISLPPLVRPSQTCCLPPLVRPTGVPLAAPTRPRRLSHSGPEARP